MSHFLSGEQMILLRQGRLRAEIMPITEERIHASLAKIEMSKNCQHFIANTVTEDSLDAP